MRSRRSRRSRRRRTFIGTLLMAALLLFAAGLPPVDPGNAQDAAPAADAEPPRGDGARRAALIEVRGEIDPLVEQFVYRALEKARDREVNVVILEIDSPGGWVQCSFDMADKLRNLEWAETVAYIPREALSGASIVALGCQKIVIHPQATFGDAGVIHEDADGAFRYVPEKMQSYLSQRLRQLAESQNRPGALAEALMNSKLKVIELRHRETDAVRYEAERDLEGMADREMWQPVRPVVESGDDRFLTLGGKRAVELQMAEGLAENQAELLTFLNVQEPPIEFRPGPLETIVTFLNFPIITGLLFVVGLVALYLEFSAPGIGIGGAICALCFAIFFWSRFLSGTAGALEILLFLAGVGFLLLEFFLIPGFGVAGLLGLGLIAASLVLASQNFVVPETPQERDRLAISLVVITGSGFFVLGSVIVLARQFGRIPMLNRLVLAPAGSTDALETGEDAAAVVRAGDMGIAQSPLRPSGKAMIGDNYVDVVADGSFIEAGQAVKVVELRGSRIVVREVQEKPIPSPKPDASG